MKTLFALFLALGLAIVCVVYYVTHLSAAPLASFRTAKVARGDVVSSIGATGTVEPETLVDVGAQVMGRIKELGVEPDDPEGKKPVDYRSAVRRGMVLAQIDDSLYKAQYDQALASLHRAEADLAQLRAKLLQTEQERKRAGELVNITDIPGTNRVIKGISDSDHDLAVANHEIAKANLKVGEATLEQSRAALALAKTNLDYTVIKSPLDGVIIERRVDVGQTVVASLNAPSLFLIAKDLKRMQVWASVNEADIGRIHAGMPVRFTVDAFPDETFRGTVEQVRLNATMTQNVVTYTVIVATDNSSLRLLPYLTANLKFEVDARRDVLAVPNAALRWTPRPEQVAPEHRGGAAAERAGQATLWVPEGAMVRPIRVRTGITDGSQTEVSGDGLEEGTEVVLGEIHEQAAATEETNPFGPPKFGGKSGAKPPPPPP